MLRRNSSLLRFSSLSYSILAYFYSSDISSNAVTASSVFVGSSSWFQEKNRLYNSFIILPSYSKEVSISIDSLLISFLRRISCCLVKRDLNFLNTCPAFAILASMVASSRTKGGELVPSFSFVSVVYWAAATFLSFWSSAFSFLVWDFLYLVNWMVMFYLSSSRRFSSTSSINLTAFS